MVVMIAQSGIWTPRRTACRYNPGSLQLVVPSPNCRFPIRPASPPSSSYRLDSSCCHRGHLSRDCRRNLWEKSHDAAGPLGRRGFRVGGGGGCRAAARSVVLGGACVVKWFPVVEHHALGDRRRGGGQHGGNDGRRCSGERAHAVSARQRCRRQRSGGAGVVTVPRGSPSRSPPFPSMRRCNLTAPLR